MNFQELMKRMAELDQTITESEMQSDEDCSCQPAGNDDAEIDECGGMMSSSPATPKQSDSVTMNVSMNGSGAGGIRDLLNVLKDIQDGPDQGEIDHEVDVGSGNNADSTADVSNILMRKNIDSMADMIDDDFGNSMPGDEGPKMGGMAMSVPDGNDLHKEKGSYPKAAGGDNPMKLKGEQSFKLPPGNLKIKLENLYNEIKSR